MLKGTKCLAEHILDRMSIFHHEAAPLTWTCPPKNHTSKAWNHVSLPSSPGLLCLFLCARDSLLDTAFVSYLHSHLCACFHRRSPRQEGSSSRSVRLGPLNTPTLPTQTKKHQSSALGAHLDSLAITLQDCEGPESHLVKRNKLMKDIYSLLLCSL